MTAEIISVGTELLLGNILNTNAQYLSRELAELGITVQRESTIGDNQGRLAGFVNEAKNRCDLLVFTGHGHGGHRREIPQKARHGKLIISQEYMKHIF